MVAEARKRRDAQRAAHQRERARLAMVSDERKKTSKQVGKDGKKFAPWMDIDEQRVDKVRAMRRENKRKTGSFFGR